MNNFNETDQGHTIAEMNVPGMPWYVPPEQKRMVQENQPTWKETWLILLSVWKVSFVVASVFAVGLVLAVVLLIWLLP